MTGGLNPDLCWQNYNPYPNIAGLQQANDLWIFVREEAPGDLPAFSKESEVSNELRELLFLYSGVIQRDPDAKDLKVIDLVSTGNNAGTLAFDKVDPLIRQGKTRTIAYD